MGIGVGLFLIAIGAILTFAVHVSTTGFNVNTIGIILMAVGAAGVLLDLVIFAPRRRVVTTAPTAQRTVVEERQNVL
ncbi:MAG TPA: DUF6458 family protein [Mycobacteriales bacterium]|jgi:hypothetical protein|nr:DUF6458 family protein [Mycobacteriales bacterium]